MDNLPNELNNLDFSSLIGGPLQAAIEAQNNAALAELNFIKSVCFNNAKGKSTQTTVDFHYSKSIMGDDGMPTTEDYVLTVPLISIISIPTLRIDEMTIDFKAKLTSWEKTIINTEGLDNSANPLYKAIAKASSVHVKASPSYSRKTTTGEVNRAYDLGVQVKIANDDIPAGLDRVLRILENQITDTQDID